MREQKANDNGFPVVGKQANEQQIFPFEQLVEYDGVANKITINANVTINGDTNIGELDIDSGSAAEGETLLADGEGGASWGLPKQLDTDGATAGYILSAGENGKSIWIAANFSGSPKGVYATLSALQAAYPTGAEGIYVVQADGHWYYWNGNAWTDGGVYQATQIEDGSVTIEKLDDYPKALINKNGNDIQEINGVVNLFNYDIVNKNIVSMSSSGVITEEENEHRFYNRTPIHLKVNDRIKVTDDNDFRFYTYYGVNGVWQQISWRMGEQTVSIEGDYIILFANVANNKTLAELIENCNIYVQDNNINSLENNDSILNEIKDEHFSFRKPRNILDTSTLKIGYKRDNINDPYTLTTDANYVVFDMVEILESGNFYLSRSNGTLQAPNPNAMAYAKDGKFIKRIENGDYVEKGWKVSINLGIASYNVWKDYLQLEIGSYTNNFVSYFKPYYVQNALKNKNVTSIAHQGINTNNKDLIGRNLVSSFVNASKLGFDYAECDIQFSSDGVPVCCHDESFVDSTTQETVVIANKTYAELITYNYYGGTIASLDDVIKTCKEHGIGLYIDHMYLCDTDAKLNTVLSSISKYKMEEKIVFMIGARSIVQKIQLWNIRSKICIHLPDVASESSIIALVEEWHNNYNEISVYLSYSAFSIADLITLNSLLPAYAKVYVFTVDTPEIAKQYAPYVSGMISNLLRINVEN